MSKRYTTNFLEDTNGNTGVAGQVLVTTASGVSWQDVENTGNNQTQGALFDSKIVLIDTPNGGLKACRVITDEYGEWIQVGRFEANAMTSIKGTWSSVSGLSNGITQAETTQFSADFGDSFPIEVRVVGATDFSNWRNTRTIDWVYKVPEGRKWKYFFSNGAENGMSPKVPLDGGASTRYGWTVNGAYDGFGRWTNADLVNIGMSDGNVTNPSAAYSAATVNAFYWQGAQDAKLSVNAYTTYSGQDQGTTSAVGNDDSINMFFDTYPTQTNNTSPGGTGFSSAVWILIKLPGGASGSGGGNYWAASGNDIYNTNSANVGIGTDSPTEELHIYGAGDRLIKIENTGTYLMYAGLISNEGYIGSTNATPLGFYTNNANRIYINTSGNVGIGTTSPGAKLDVVSGDAAVLTLQNTENNFAANQQRIDFYGKWYHGLPNSMIRHGIIAGEHGDSSGYQRGNLKFYTNFDANLVDAMTIRYDGNVGIGTTSPAVRLDYGASVDQAFHLYTSGVDYYGINMTIYDIDGPYSTNIFSGDGGQIKFRTSTGTSTQTTRMTITAAGNVGIGTTNPANRRLVVSSNINDEWVGSFIHTGTNPYGLFVDTSANTSGGFTFAAYTFAGGGFYVKNSGNVGIGTTAPTRKLHIVSSDDTRGIMVEQTLASSYAEIHFKASREYRIGTGGSTSAAEAANNWYVYDATAAAQRFVITSAGSVGIGTSDPDSLLNIRKDTAGITSIFSLTNSQYAASDDTGSSIRFQGYTGFTPGSANPRYSEIIGVNGTSSVPKRIDFKFYADAVVTTPLSILQGGNVGIGTISPQGKLEVNNRNTATGAALFIKGGEDDLDPIAGQYTGLAFGYGGGEIYNNGGILWEFTNAAANGKLHFAVNPTAGDGTVNLTDSKMTILDSGNVGIGTTSPDLGAIAGTRVLTIASPETERWGILELAGNRTWGGNQVGEIKFISTDATNNGTLVSLTAVNDTTALGTGGSLNFATRANGGSLTTKMSITSTGNVGIGTTTPFGTAANRTVLSVNGTTDVSLNVGTGGSQRAYLYGSSTYADLGTIGSLPLVFSPNNTERMRITSSGNVGIGTTSPGGLGEKLTVIGSINSNNTALFYGDGTDNSANLYSTAGPIKFLANASERMRIDSSGNVGIGTTAPSADLHIYENGPSTLLIESAAANGNDTYLALKNSAAEWRLTTNRGDQITGAQGDFFIRENDSLGNAFVIKQNTGNVGIGTTTPSHKLHVSGDRIVVENITDAGIMFRTASVDRYSVASTSGDFQIYDEVNSVNRLAITSGGDVGIGITSPTEKLDVDGVVNATSFSAGGTAGFTGTVNFPSNPPGSQSLDFQGGLLVGVS